MRDLAGYEEQYKNQPYERFQVYFRKKKMKQILAENNHDTLLEIGCGLESIFHDIDTFKKLYVVEPAIQFYAKAQNEIAVHKRKNDITIINKIIEEANRDFKNIEFDFILLSSLLHEIQNPDQLLKVLYDLATDKTVIHINVPNAKSFHRLLAVEMGLIKNEFQKSGSNILFQQNTIFDLKSLGDIVEQNGFKILDSGSYSFKPFTHEQMESLVQSDFLTNEMLEGFYKMEKYLPGLGSEIFVNVVKK